MHYLQAAIFAEAEQGSCILIGRGANIILKSMPALISVYLSARSEIRIERVKSYFHCDEKRAAQIIDRSDKDRIGFHRAFFDIEWGHPGNYHISLNTGIFSPSDCADFVYSLKDRFFTPETEAQNLVILKNLALEHEIKHRILYEKELPIRFLEISVSDNIVTLYGTTNSQALLDAAVSSAQEVADSSTIRNEIQIIREYGVMP